MAAILQTTLPNSFCLKKYVGLKFVPKGQNDDQSALGSGDGLVLSR